MNFLLPEFLNTGKTGPGADGETYYLMLGFKGNENLPIKQNKDRPSLKTVWPTKLDENRRQGIWQSMQISKSDTIVQY